MAEARTTEFFGETQIREQVLDFMGLGSCMPREAWRLPSPQTSSLRAMEIRKWGHTMASLRWHPPEDGAAQLAVAHFKTGGPVHDDALSRLGDTQGPLLLMLPTDIAAALR